MLSHGDDAGRAPRRECGELGGNRSEALYCDGVFGRRGGAQRVLSRIRGRHGSRRAGGRRPIFGVL